MIEQIPYVRSGTVEDLNAIMTLARTINVENGVFKMNDDKVRNMIYPCLDGKRHGIVGVIGTHEFLEGLIVLRVSNFWYSDTPFLEELCVYVHPNFRAASGGRLRRLVEFGKKTATELSMPLMIGILSNTRTNAKVRLYERQFGAPAGAFFLWGASTGNVKPEDLVTA